MSSDAIVCDVPRKMEMENKTRARNWLVESNSRIMINSRVEKAQMVPRRSESKSK